MSVIHLLLYFILSTLRSTLKTINSVKGYCYIRQVVHLFSLHKISKLLLNRTANAEIPHFYDQSSDSRIKNQRLVPSLILIHPKSPLLWRPKRRPVTNTVLWGCLQTRLVFIAPWGCPILSLFVHLSTRVIIIPILRLSLKLIWLTLVAHSVAHSTGTTGFWCNFQTSEPKRYDNSVFDI